MNRRSRAEKRELVVEWKGSGETAAIFCERQGISRSTLYRWNRDDADEGTEGLSFIPVVVATLRPEQRQEPCRSHVGSLFIVECGEDPLIPSL
jgi:transposase-like protein